MGAVDLVVQIEAPPSRRGRPAAGRPGRAPGRRGVPRRGLPQAPRRPALLRGRRRADARRAASRSCATRATRSTCWPSRSSRWWRWTRGRSATWPCWCAGPRPSPSCPTRRCTPCSTCSPGATRRPPSPSCARAWSGTAPPTCSPAGPAPSGWRSPAAAPSPTAACSASSWPAPSGPRGSASSTRRWSTSRGSATSSCSARLLADRGHHARPGAGLPRPGQAGPDAVLEGRPAGPAGRAGPGDRRPAARRWCRQGDEAAARRCAAAGWTSGRPTTCLAYLDEQREATRHLPDDRTVVVERFRDELGDWRLAVHCVLGAKVNGAWALAIGAPADRAVRRGRAGACPVRRRHRGPPARTPPTSRPAPTWSPSTPRRSRRSSRSRSARRRCSPPRFRECAARALLLPRRDPRRRQPLWQQRQRAAQLLDVAREFADFPVTLEAARECLQDVLRRARPGRADARPRRPQGAAGRGGDAAAVAVRPVAAVRLRRRVPLRGRRAAGRAPGGRAGAGLHAARRAARPGRAARAARPGGGRRDRAAAAVARPASARPRDAEDAPSCCGCSATCPPRSASRAAPSPAWLAELARGPPGDRGAHRRRGALDRRRGRRPRRDALGVALPVGVAERVPRAGRRPARRPGRPVRPHPRAVHRRRPARPGSGSACSWSSRRSSGSPPPGGWSPASSRPDGARHRVVRRRGAALLRRRSLAALRREIEPVPPRRAGRVPAPLAAGRLVGPRRRGGRRRDRAAAGRARCRPRRWERLVLPGPGRRLLARLPRRAVRQRRGGLGRRRARSPAATAGSPWPTPTPPRCCCRRPTTALALTPLHEAVLDALGGGQALFFRSAVRPGRLHRRRRAGRRGVGPGLGRPAHQRHPRAAAGAARRRRRAPGAGGARHAPATGGPAGRRGSPCRRAPARRPSAGRWSRLPERDTDPTRRAAALADALLERHGVVTRGAVAGRGRDRRVRRGLPGAGGAGGARRGPARLLRRRAGRGPVRRARRGRPAARAGRADRAGERGGGRPLVLAATDPANPYGAALPWPERVVDTGDGEAAGDRPPGRPQGRRAGRPGRRRAGALRRARRPHPAVLHRRPRRARRGGQGAGRRGALRRAGRRCRSNAPTARPCTPRRCGTR